MHRRHPGSHRAGSTRRHLALPRPSAPRRPCSAGILRRPRTRGRMRRAAIAQWSRIRENEGEGHRPAVGTNRLDDAPHPGDPSRGEHLRQPEIALAVEAALLAGGIRVGNTCRDIPVVAVAFDGGKGRNPAPALDVEGLLDAALDVLRRQFGPHQKRLDRRCELLGRGTHQAAERTCANNLRTSSGTLSRKPGSNTRRCSVSFRKLTGS